MINYIPLEELIDEHITSLYSYYDAGLDTSLLYGHIVRCLGQMGFKILPIKDTIINIENYGSDLPSDYVSLISLYSSTKINKSTPVLHGQITYEKEYCHVEPCMTENSYNHNEFGRYKNIYVFENDNYQINVTKPLIIGTKIDGCNNPINLRNYDAEIKNKQILTQFETGSLFLVYRSSITEGGILVPDYPEITSWLLAEMETYSLRHLLLNTTNDVVQRYNLVKQELHIAKENARSFWKRNSLQDFFDVKAYLNRGFKILSRNGINK